jgi:uncharacterized small protein (TIGR04563 family)
MATEEKSDSSSSLLRAEPSKADKRKQSLYFPEAMLVEMKEEASRLKRSLSWVVQRAWKVARKEVKKLPGVNDAQG